MFYLWSFAAGLIHIPIYSFPWPVSCLFVAALSCVFLARRGWIFTGYLACFLFGMALGSWNLQRLCKTQLPHVFDHTEHPLTFTIVSIPKRAADSATFLVTVDDVHCTNTDCPALDGKTLRISWYKPHESVAAGQVWRARVKLRRPRGFVNPGGFDYHAWLLAQDVVATGSVARGAELLRQDVVWATHRERLERTLLESRTTSFGRFWSALLIGEQNAISQGDWAILQATGTVHLLVISGLHIGLAAGWCFAIGALVGRFLGFCHRGSNARVMQFVPPVFACVGAAYYAALAGFSIPTIRASVACLALMVCRMTGLNLSPFALLGIAVAVVGICEPLAWESAGFWLSFLAVALLFYVFAGRFGQRAAPVFVRTQVVMALGLMLPLLCLGQGLSLTGPLANLVAVPVVSFVLVPMLLTAALLNPVWPRVVDLILPIMDWIFDWLWAFLTWLATWPSALWWPEQTVSGGAFALAAAGTLLMLAPAGLLIRGLGALWLVTVFCLRSSPEYLLRVVVMDVGQGQAVILQTPTQTWLYDAGPAFSDQFDAGSRIVAPYLRQLGVHELNMMISHADLDHAGGVAGIAAAMNLRQVLYGERLELPAATAEYCRQGMAWQVDSVKFSVLWPPDGDHQAGNNSSCVLLLELDLAGQPVRLLLPGDIDRKVEQRLLDHLPQPVDWLLAPHHGSQSSSSYRLLYRTQPRFVVISAGYRNRYGHPHPKITQRYTEIGAEIFNTAKDGALIFTWKADGVEVTKARREWARLWHKTLD